MERSSQAWTKIPATDSSDNETLRDVVGSKSDTGTSGDSVVALVKQVSNNLLPGGKEQGSISYLDAGGEVMVAEITSPSGVVVHGIWLDLVNMTQDGTIRVYSKVDGSNYRLTETYSFTVATDPDGFFIDRTFGLVAGQDFKVTYEEGADEGADRALPYSILKQGVVVA
jgi:hypothetical protein